MEGVPIYLSAEKYAEYSGLGVEEVKRLCNLGEIHCSRTKSGRYKIPVYKNGITKEQYEELQTKYTELKSTLNSIKNILEVG